jgi:hypothetical protein
MRWCDSVQEIKKFECFSTIVDAEALPLGSSRFTGNAEVMPGGGQPCLSIYEIG